MPASALRLLIVTPEKTLLDEAVSAIRFPLFDGQIGILPDRAPMIGRLGYGELKLTTPNGEERSYFVDGGFVQVKGATVSILTGRSLPAGQIDAQDAGEQLQAASRRVPTTPAEFAAKDRDQERARRMLELARKAR
jgi:F-type H+-transporting ATPase subunit epsilon